MFFFFFSLNTHRRDNITKKLEKEGFGTIVSLSIWDQEIMDSILIIETPRGPLFLLRLSLFRFICLIYIPEQLLLLSMGFSF